MPKTPTDIRAIISSYLQDPEITQYLNEAHTIAHVLTLIEEGIILANPKYLAITAAKFQDALPMGEGVTTVALCEFVDTCIQSPKFGKDLDVAEFIFRLVHDADGAMIDPKRKVEFIRQVFAKTQIFARQYVYEKRYFDTRTMSLTTHKFIFEVCLQHNPKHHSFDHLPILNNEKTENIIRELYVSYFECNLPMKLYIINRYAELSDQKPFISIARQLTASSPLLQPPSTQELSARDRDHDLVDLSGKRKPEAPLLLSSRIGDYGSILPNLTQRMFNERSA